MTKSLSHLPKTKQREIAKILEIIKEEAKPEKVILFGSYATGKWVDSFYKEDGIKLSYISDYDFLVVIGDDNEMKESQIISHIENRCNDFDGIVSPLIHRVSYINKGLSFGQFFFTRIIDEGILLFDDESSSFDTPKHLTQQEEKEKAQGYFDIWFPIGNEFVLDAINAFDRHNTHSYRKAAFELHQAAENFYGTILLVYAGYKPTIHNLQKMRKYSKHFSNKLYSLFLTPSDDEYEYHLFDLLKRGYIEARYKPNYIITKKECQDLINKIKLMQNIVKNTCLEKINAII